MADSAADASKKAQSARPCSATVNMVFLSRVGRFFFANCNNKLDTPW